MNTREDGIANNRQAGAALMVVLILLLIMTLLGLAVLRSTTLQERMSANLFDRSLNFQAAEAALREGEALAQAQVTAPATGSGCVAGVCETPLAGAVERWRDPAFTGWRQATTPVGQLASAADYFIEYVGTSESWLECNVDPRYAGTELCVRPVYRVTARSEADGRASVMLQSNYIAP